MEKRSGKKTIPHLDMSKIATKVYLIIRGEQLSGDQSLQEKVNKSAPISEKEKEMPVINN